MSSKAKSLKGYQGNIFQFFIFLVALVGYLFLNDNSFELFLQDVKHVMDLNFSDHHLLNALFWVVGFWGMIVMLNLNNKYCKALSWFVLIISSTISFAYLQVHKSTFSYHNSSECFSVMKQFFSIETMALIRFFIVNVVMVALAFILKPLSVSLDKTILIALLVVITLSFIVSGGQSVQAMYFVPIVFCYKYILVLFYWLKDIMSPSSR